MNKTLTNPSLLQRLGEANKKYSDSPYKMLKWLESNKTALRKIGVWMPSTKKHA